MGLNQCYFWSFQQESQQVLMTLPFIYLCFNSMLDWIKMGEKTDILEKGTGDLQPWMGRPNSKKGFGVRHTWPRVLPHAL